MVNLIAVMTLLLTSVTQVLSMVSNIATEVAINNNRQHTIQLKYNA